MYQVQQLVCQSCRFRVKPCTNIDFPIITNKIYIMFYTPDRLYLILKPKHCVTSTLVFNRIVQSDISYSEPLIQNILILRQYELTN